MPYLRYGRAAGRSYQGDGSRCGAGGRRTHRSLWPPMIMPDATCCFTPSTVQPPARGVAPRLERRLRKLTRRRCRVDGAARLPAPEHPPRRIFEYSCPSERRLTTPPPNIKPRFSNLRSFRRELRYGREDIKQVIENNISVVPKSELADKTNSNLMLLFLGRDNEFVTNVGTAKQEPVINYWIRHCSLRPRDAVTIGKESVSFERGIELNTRSARNQLGVGGERGNLVQ